MARNTAITVSAKAAVCNSEFRVHRQWFDQSAMDGLPVQCGPNVFGPTGAIAIPSVDAFDRQVDARRRLLLRHQHAGGVVDLAQEVIF